MFKSVNDGDRPVLKNLTKWAYDQNPNQDYFDKVNHIIRAFTREDDMEKFISQVFSDYADYMTSMGINHGENGFDNFFVGPNTQTSTYNQWFTDWYNILVYKLMWRFKIGSVEDIKYKIFWESTVFVVSAYHHGYQTGAYHLSNEYCSYEPGWEESQKSRFDAGMCELVDGNCKLIQMCTKEDANNFGHCSCKENYQDCDIILLCYCSLNNSPKENLNWDSKYGLIGRGIKWNIESKRFGKNDFWENPFTIN